MKLSAYTIAKNCLDLNDCLYGIEELKQFISSRKNPPKTALVRLSRLEDHAAILKAKADVSLVKDDLDAIANDFWAIVDYIRFAKESKRLYQVRTWLSGDSVNLLFEEKQLLFDRLKWRLKDVLLQEAMNKFSKQS